MQDNNFSSLSDGEVDVMLNRAFHFAGKLWMQYQGSPKQQKWLRKSLFDSAIESEAHWLALKKESLKREALESAE